MYKQSLELNKFGLSAMTEFEMMEVDGGSFWKWLEGIGVAVLAVGIAVGSAGLASAGVAAIVVGYLGDQSTPDTNPNPQQPS